MANMNFIVEDRGYDTPCHVWQGALDADGYGVVSVEGKARRAHIVAWQEDNGRDLGEGMVLDHLCRTRACCNSGHLEEITQAENILRGANQSAEASFRETCKHGHPYTPENTFMSFGTRRCRQCHAEVVKAGREAALEKRQGKDAPAKPPKAPLTETRTSDLEAEELCVLLVNAAVRLMVEDKPAKPQDVWREVKRQGDPPAVPRYAKKVMEGSMYTKLLDIRLRRQTINEIEGMTFIRSLAADLTKLAGDSLVEDLLLNPGRMSMSEKRKTVLELGNFYERLLGKGRLGNAPAEPAATPEEAVTEMSTEMQDNLDKMPPALRDRFVREWKVREMQRITEQETRMRGSGQATG
jgi:hypothetical protein